MNSKEVKEVVDRSTIEICEHNSNYKHEFEHIVNKFDTFIYQAQCASIAFNLLVRETFLRHAMTAKIEKFHFSQK